MIEYTLVYLPPLLAIGYTAASALKNRDEPTRAAWFLATLLGTWVWLLIAVAVQPTFASGPAGYYLVVSAVLVPILLLIIAIGLALNTPIVIRREGLRLATLTPAAISTMILGTMVLIILTLIGGDSQTYRIVQTALLILVAPAGIVLTIQLIAYWICAIFHTNSLKDRVVDTVIILGAGLNGDQVTPLLAARLNQGLKVANRTAGETDATFIVSGGQGNDETISEAEAMKSYLIKKGIDPDRILAEEDSTTTLENITFSKNLMEERNISPQGLAIVTNNFHVLRTASIAKSLNLESITIGSPTALYYYPSAFLREYAAMVVHFRRPTIALSTMPTIVMTAAYLTQWAIQ